MNKSQYEAVHFAEGALQLLAGPGSGKTFVITHRIRFLISEHGISPEKILVITFTKAAALEMQERYKKLTGLSSGVVFGTFHAVFYQILRTLPEFKNISLISETEKLKMIDELLKQMHAERYTMDQSYTNVLRQISKYKNDPKASYDHLEDIMEPDLFERFMAQYQQMLKETDRLDFDDMVLLCYEALKKDRNLLACWQDRFDYIMIDEFQDINALQYEVVKLLTAGKNNLFVVGDDDQSIYGFRGAKPEIMQRFLNEFENASQMCLNYNYRSREEIVKTAESIIRENKNRFTKNMVAARSGGGHVSLVKCGSSEEEMRQMIKQIKALQRDGIPAGEIAILARTNRELQAMTPFLDQAGIPYAGQNTKKRLSEQKYVQVIRGYFGYLAGDHSRQNFYRFMNKPLRYIKRDAIVEERVDKAQIMAYYEGNYRMQNTVLALFSHLQKMERMKPSLALHYIRNVLGMDRYVKENETAEAFRMYTDACDRLKSMIKEQQTFDGALELFERQSEADGRRDDTAGIRLMTYHASKGLEFTAVFLPELIDGKVPPKQARTADLVEEERRMFYVAVTRAKDHLYLYTVCNAREEVSRFLLIDTLKIFL